MIDAHRVILVIVSWGIFGGGCPFKPCMKPAKNSEIKERCRSFSGYQTLLQLHTYTFTQTHIKMRYCHKCEIWKS